MNSRLTSAMMRVRSSEGWNEKSDPLNVLTVVSRKNFLFIGSDAGGERAAILYSLIETAKLHGLTPEASLAQAVDQLARGHLASRLSELLPWNCKNAVSP